MTPKELSTYYIEKIVEEKELLSKLKLFFPKNSRSLWSSVVNK